MQTLSEKLQKLETQKKQIIARQRALLARQSDIDRKRRTRAKIIVGGLVLAAARSDAELVEFLRSIIAEKLSGPDLTLVSEIYPLLVDDKTPTSHVS